MLQALSSAVNYLASFRKSEPSASTLFNPGDPFQVETRLAVRALNQQISDWNVLSCPSSSSSTPRSTTKTPVFKSTAKTSSPNTSSFLWIVRLSFGGVLCLGLTGGTALILHRRRGSSNNAADFIERGSKAHDSFVMKPVKKRKVIQKLAGNTTN